MDISEEKLGFGILIVLLMAGAWVLTYHLGALAPTFSTLVGGFTGVFALFCGGNVMNKWVDGKNGQPAQLAEEDLTSSPFTEPHPDSNCKK